MATREHLEKGIWRKKDGQRSLGAAGGWWMSHHKTQLGEDKCSVVRAALGMTSHMSDQVIYISVVKLETQYVDFLLWVMDVHRSLTSSVQSLVRVVVISHSHKLWNRNCILKSSEMLIIWGPFCCTAVLIRAHSRHVEFISATVVHNQHWGNCVQ